MIHPETGEVIASREDYQAALMDIEERMKPLYRLRNALFIGRGMELDPAVLPLPRARTPTQDRVARCPRCGMKLENEEAPA